jgi:PilZ domain-containing protein
MLPALVRLRRSRSDRKSLASLLRLCEHRSTGTPRNLTRMVKRMTTPAAYRHFNSTSTKPDIDSADTKNSGLHPNVVRSERRTTQRFPIQLPAELCIREMRFHGTTVNISSGGLLMKCSHDMLKVGKRVKVRITNWPSSNEKRSDVTLIVEGAVLRDSSGYLAVRRTRYEFVDD